MRIISRKALREFWSKHTDAEQALKTWFAETKNAHWRNSIDIKRVHRSASFLNDNKIVVNIKGNKYRLITAVNYDFGIVYIKFIGTNRQYDKIDAANI